MAILPYSTAKTDKTIILRHLPVTTLVLVLLFLPRRRLRGCSLPGYSHNVRLQGTTQGGANCFILFVIAVTALGGAHVRRSYICGRPRAQSREDMTAIQSERTGAKRVSDPYRT